jgi:hypothetical protein
MMPRDRVVYKRSRADLIRMCGCVNPTLSELLTQWRFQNYFGGAIV